ncbi:MAG: hypothetical protein QXX62_05195 [Metallosphaera sp.]|uniref:Uncharacterized protein n=3 Tax=Metallosphaera TaxID=41980 RepID=A4YDQ0_METS5|nr:hypothetical protein Msed_0375 [Metallosphaera sedula DSM 5348]AIM26539.1 hypothetical protein HA72_0375 [Metallosphaera sedula]AKV73528.1 hypothetical protein MsedA_0388 [Metallosphaera sedula]AKV75770.1 hypothetical protein MsedB_0388 [Metallosphaera sedula]AKV78017.1 hypothetical protein MsedC_0387 [Metallosphaera sedula]
MRPINPFFYVFLFFNATVFLPIVINGIRIVSLWYSPLADTGQITFVKPFLVFVIAYLAVSVIVGVSLYKSRRGRFILVHGPMRLRAVLRATLKDSVGRAMIAVFVPAYYLSFLVVSGLLLIPNLNVSSYFMGLTAITYQGEGIPMLGDLVLNVPLLLLGVLNDVVLTLSLIFSYYVMSLLYVSSSAMKWAAPKSLRMGTLNTTAGFLTASIPSIGTIAGICCLSPTAMNSLLYLLSGSYPALTKGITWKYGAFIAGAWTGGILQAILLLSPTIAGMILLGVGIWQITVISSQLVKRSIGIEVPQK